MSTRSIDLITPVPFAGQMVSNLTLREPGMREYAALGEPVVQTRSADGAWVVVENSDVVIGYMRALVPPDRAGVLDHIGLADILNLKGAVLDFFMAARLAGQADAPASSSSTSDGSPPANLDS